ncbi:hypothetical protein AaE_010938 [Aphanomyces astaci]|uniref:RxLR effector protein n=1 Tax=Aphanomyces astaci TaxID=112090 RepID=A0A6A4ZMV7_APHAT|nr:hypothetical protein AaE_010938 [Aphanomyces astaci]
MKFTSPALILAAVGAIAHSLGAVPSSNRLAEYNVGVPDQGNREILIRVNVASTSVDEGDHLPTPAASTPSPDGFDQTFETPGTPESPKDSTTGVDRANQVGLLSSNATTSPPKSNASHPTTSSPHTTAMRSGAGAIGVTVAATVVTLTGFLTFA